MDEYDAITDVPVVRGATLWMDQHTNEEYILVFNEALWMGDTLAHSLINPNQLRAFGTLVLDNPYHTDPLGITPPPYSLEILLCTAGTIIYAYFAAAYPMESKALAGDALKEFITDYGVPDKIIMDGAGEQTGKRSTFMEQVRKHHNDYHVTEPERYNQSRVEGVIREIRKKWFRVMTKKYVPKWLWDYGLRWVVKIKTNSFRRRHAAWEDGIRKSNRGDLRDIRVH